MSTSLQTLVDRYFVKFRNLFWCRYNYSFFATHSMLNIHIFKLHAHADGMLVYSHPDLLRSLSQNCCFERLNSWSLTGYEVRQFDTPFFLHDGMQAFFTIIYPVLQLSWSIFVFFLFPFWFNFLIHFAESRW